MVFESLGSASFNATEMSPQSTTRLSLISDPRSIFTRFTSLPAMIWFRRVLDIAATGEKNGDPDCTGTAVAKVLLGVTAGMTSSRFSADTAAAAEAAGAAEEERAGRPGVTSVVKAEETPVDTEVEGAVKEHIRIS